MKFRTWLDGKSRTKTLKGRILAHIRQCPDPEGVLRNVAEGRLAGVTEEERKAARRLYWEFRRAGGEPEGDEPPADLRKAPGGGRKPRPVDPAAAPLVLGTVEAEEEAIRAFYRALGLPL